MNAKVKKLIIGTQNKSKFKEICSALSEIDLEIKFPPDLGIHEEPKETGKSFKENADIKARFYFDASQIPCVSDDSGIFVTALKDELGMHTRRWGAGEKASDQEWLNFFLEKMSNMEDRTARFVSFISFFDGEKILSFQGEVRGEIAREPQSEIEAGIPLSSVFVPDGSNKVFSAMTKQEKNAFSHRGKALKKFMAFLGSSFSK